ncbi:hypothetical protein CMQ_6425 [Grosmannia clavigera kw1407]|uniref:Uncharacterized protein n=1 Tax=Grosmannia clavigera (strain kw1407 / UAMH 11150) TaxID=655863 RepID=F0XMS8_GROCL|nr:uncharacterized protein CMQ_6425 [Grosmannia clavigera kw1407]EFX01483.1 hypothetical protein CMQ_6425 [Grosmannia clavigera kw1407]
MTFTSALYNILQNPVLIVGFLRPDSPRSHWPSPYESSTASTQTEDNWTEAETQPAEQQNPEQLPFVPISEQPVESLTERPSSTSLTERPSSTALHTLPPFGSFSEFIWRLNCRPSSNGSSTNSTGAVGRGDLW